MLRRLLLILLSSAILSPAFAIPPPENTPTIFVRGFDSSGATHTGVFGVDTYDATIANLIGTLGLPLSTTAPLALNQVAYADYYGDTPPPYYTSADVAQLNTITAQYGGGIPRYAFIIAKFAREVMRRTGTNKVNIFAVSMGGLVSRWMIEKDVDGIASSGKIARWIVVEGVVCGNWACSQAGGTIRDWIQSNYDLNSIDLTHMRYDWIDANLHNPHDTTACTFFSQFETHFWLPSSDALNSQALTYASLEPNDGVQLLRDTFFHNLTSPVMYLGRWPTRSAVHATHESSKQNLGIRAGIAANLTGRRRVTITLDQVYVINDHESSWLGDGEFVFGVKVTSPRALQQMGVSDPIQDLRSEDHNVDYVRIPEKTSTTLGLIWFDDLILPGETSLHLQSNVDQMNYDLVYGLTELASNSSEHLSDAVLDVSTLTSGTYPIATADWRGMVTVSILDYPAFETPSGVGNWEMY